MYRMDNITKEITEVDGNNLEELRSWALWFEDINNTRIAYHEVGNLIVSTVFLGIDHNMGYDDRPVLFETIIFDKTKTDKYGNHESVYMQRYSDFDIAFRHHEFIVTKLEGMLDHSNHLEIETR